MAKSKVLKPPFTYFGGKSKVADIVWRALGNPKHYIEPFFGSGAVLLGRPNGAGHLETVNDADGHLCNVWRALQADPDGVAKVCDWPVNHADLIARKKVLHAEDKPILERLCADDKYYDVQLAGYWIWGTSCSIGKAMVCKGDIIPEVSGSGKGVHAKGKIPEIACAGRGIHASGKRPHLHPQASGINKKSLMFDPAGPRPQVFKNTGIHKQGIEKDEYEGELDVREPYNTNLFIWFRRLSERLRNVRVVCGDWSRVCGGSWQDHGGACGVFFDPPYGTEADRATDIYQSDSLTVAKDVREWCRERGSKPSYRIVLAGYYEEHESLLSDGWTHERWSANGGYAHTGGPKDSKGKKNRHREALFFSPHCLKGRNTFFGEVV